MIIIPEEVIEYFGRSNIPSLFLITRLKENDIQIIEAINELTKQVSAILTEPTPEYLILASQSKHLPLEQAKFSVTAILIDRALAARRILILSDTTSKVIKPYDHKDLNGIKVDNEGLVKLEEFDFISKSPSLVKGLTAFDILPSIFTAINSMYWAHKELIKNLSSKANIYIRLDPLLLQPVIEYKPLFQKMLVYGKPLDWNYIYNLKSIIHSRWQPDYGWQDDVEFTDLVWSPCDDGIEFICEEIPKSTSNSTRGSRYFHSILNPNKHTIEHCDGATRIFSDGEISERRLSHVRNIGKIGKRIKIFRVDGNINIEDWTNLVCAFYVWNNDIQNYFGLKNE